MLSRSDWLAAGLAGLLAGASVGHIVQPKFYDSMIPSFLPGAPNLWTKGSAAAEVTVAALVAVPATRRIGAIAAAGLFVAVFPANVQMTVDAFTKDRSTQQKVISVVRLPLQVPLIRWALAVRRTG